MLKNGMDTLRIRCVDGIVADEAQCRKTVERSLALVTALVPVLGYEICSTLAKEAMATGRSVYALVLEKELLPKKELEEILKPENMVRPR
jgi:aspartate ammonia-lyase